MAQRILQRIAHILVMAFSLLFLHGCDANGDHSEQVTTESGFELHPPEYLRSQRALTLSQLMVDVELLYIVNTDEYRSPKTAERRGTEANPFWYVSFDVPFDTPFELIMTWYELGDSRLDLVRLTREINPQPISSDNFNYTFVPESTFSNDEAAADYGGFDIDDDAQTNLEELLAGTDPFVNNPPASNEPPNDETVVEEPTIEEPVDADSDGVPDTDDNCPMIANADQMDADGDGAGDLCDVTNEDDLDGDGVRNTIDNCPEIANTQQENIDGDSRGDACDAVNDQDSDGDGVNNDLDVCPFAPDPGQADADGNGTGDACEPVQGAFETQTPFNLSPWSALSDMEYIDDTLYFSGTLENGSSGIFSTTVDNLNQFSLVLDIREVNPWLGNPRVMTRVGRWLMFHADSSGAVGIYGFNVDTREVISVGLNERFVAFLTDHNGELFFRLFVNDGVQDLELLSFDVDGSRQVRNHDINPDGHLANLFSYQNHLYFTARTDGLANATTLYQYSPDTSDLSPISYEDVPVINDSRLAGARFFTEVDGEIFFMGASPETDTTISVMNRLDPSTNSVSTISLKDNAGNIFIHNPEAHTSKMPEIDGKLYIPIFHSADGTMMTIAEVDPVTSSYREVGFILGGSNSEMVASDGVLYVSINNNSDVNDHGLWAYSPGSDCPFQLIADTNPDQVDQVQFLTPVPNGVAYVARDSNNDLEIFVTRQIGCFSSPTPEEPQEPETAVCPCSTFTEEATIANNQNGWEFSTPLSDSQWDIQADSVQASNNELQLGELQGPVELLSNPPNSLGGGYYLEWPYVSEETPIESSALWCAAQVNPVVRLSSQSQEYEIFWETLRETVAGATFNEAKACADLLYPGYSADGD